MQNNQDRAERTERRVGLVGAGYISPYHIAALRRTPGVRLLGVHDLNDARARALAATHGLEVFASIETLREAGADVIHVLTPPESHAAVAMDALRAGCHVLVEKPLATDPDDCGRVAALAEEMGLRVCVNHSLLFDPQVRRALETVRSGKLGRVVSVDILRGSTYPPYEGGPLPPQYRSAGYPFRDLGVHALYLMEAFLGPVEHVHADFRSVGGDPNLAYDEWRAQVRCRDGLGQFQLSWNVRPMQSQIIVQGTRGVLRADLFLMFNAMRKSTPLPKAAERIVNALTDSLRPMIDVPKGVVGFVCKRVRPYHGLQELVREFYRTLGTNEAEPVSVADATRVVRWTEQVARAADREYASAVRVFTTSDSVPVLVTGAAGAVGGAVVRRLRADGRRVRVLMRRLPERIDEGVEVVIGDLGNPAAVDRAVRGAEAVVHAGAAMKGGWAEHLCGTVTGTKNVLDACARFGVRKLVHVSSMSVLDWAGGRKGDVLCETSPLEPRAEERGSYTRAKLEAEDLVIRFAADGKVPTVILRPGQIFGGKLPVLTPAVARWAGRRWVVLGNGKMPLPLIHLDDVVEAVVAAMNTGDADGQVVQLVAPNSPTQNEVLRLAAGDGASVVRVPRPVIFMMGAMSQVVFRLLKRQSPLGVYRLKSALRHRSFASVRSHLLTGWVSRVDVREAIAAAAGPVRAEARPETRTRTTPALTPQVGAP